MKYKTAIEKTDRQWAGLTQEGILQTGGKSQGNDEYFKLTKGTGGRQKNQEIMREIKKKKKKKKKKKHKKDCRISNHCKGVTRCGGECVKYLWSECKKKKRPR